MIFGQFWYTRYVPVLTNNGEVKYLIEPKVCFFPKQVNNQYLMKCSANRDPEQSNILYIMVPCFLSTHKHDNHFVCAPILHCALPLAQRFLSQPPVCWTFTYFILHWSTQSICQLILVMNYWKMSKIHLQRNRNVGWSARWILCIACTGNMHFSDTPKNVIGTSHWLTNCACPIPSLSYKDS